MNKNATTRCRGLVFLIFLSVLLGVAPRTLQGAAIRIDNVSLGKVIDINGQKFVKVGFDPVRGSQFQALKAACLPNKTPYFTGTMQDFTTSDCESVPTPGPACHNYVGTLIDERDGKSYEIRKFADGKCWMADNLKYGGAIDACVDKTIFYEGTGAAAVFDRFGAGTYGECRNNPGSSDYGYMYDWFAVVQAPVRTSYQPVEPTQGLCPSGWHVPTGNIGGEYEVLDRANGGSGAYRNNCVTEACNFFRPGHSFKGVYAGYCDFNGNLLLQGSYMYWWTSTQSSNNEVYGYSLQGGATSFWPGNYIGSYKSNGRGVRCMKDVN